MTKIYPAQGWNNIKFEAKQSAASRRRPERPLGSYQCSRRWSTLPAWFLPTILTLAIGAGSGWVIHLALSQYGTPRTICALTSAIGGLLVGSLSCTIMVLVTRLNQVRVLSCQLDDHISAQRDFINSVAHELRNGIHAVLGSVEVLHGEREGMTKAQDHALDDVMVHSRVVGTLLNDILDMGRVGNHLTRRDTKRNTNQMFTLQQIVDPINTYCRNETATRPVEWNIVCDHATLDGLVFVGQPTWILQCLSNLVTNAMKNTLSGSITLTIHCVSATKSPRYGAVLTAGPANLTISVTDTGVGIDKRALSKIFERFDAAGKRGRHEGRPSFSSSRTSSSQSGVSSVLGRTAPPPPTTSSTGLGLPIVRQLVDAMGGTLEVNSCKGRGSTFTIVIPVTITQYSSPSSDDRVVGPSGYGQHKTHQDVCIGIPNQAQSMSSTPVHHKHASVSSTSPLVGKCSSPKSQVRLARVDDEPLRRSITRADPLRRLRQFDQTLTAKPKPAPGGGGGMVLVVDDDSINLRIMVKFIEKFARKNRVKVATACNGLDAVNKFTEHADQVRVVLLDIQMPVMDGYAAIKRIRALRSAVPVVATTANASQDDRTRLMAAGFTSVLAKPYTKRQVLDCVRAHAVNSVAASSAASGAHPSAKTSTTFSAPLAPPAVLPAGAPLTFEI